MCYTVPPCNPSVPEQETASPEDALGSDYSPGCCISSAAAGSPQRKRLAGARSICLDAYGTDSTGKKYDLEIQREDRGAEPHRARYHSSVMDIENLNAGEDFNALPDTYTIFITEKDFFGMGEPVYQIERINLETGKPFEDGEHILYVNGEYRDDSDIEKLLHDFNCTDADDMNFELMAQRTRYLKETRRE